MGNCTWPNESCRKGPVRRIVPRGFFYAVLAALFLSLPTASGTVEVTAEIRTADNSNVETAVHEAISREDRNRIVLTSTAVGIGAVTVWGVLNWDYFSQSPSWGSEGWFGEDTKNGGVDKLGHLYTSYVLSHGLACFYEYCDFDRNEAALYGSLTSCAIMGYMEFGDSFSSYGFSYEDLIMNTAGCLVAYVLYVNPELASKIDLRWQIGLQPTQGDFFTDYENSKFLLALKLNGFEAAQKTFWKHIELHLGYYAEGFGSEDEDKHRYVYVGVGFNLTDLFRRHGYRKTATVFNYIQLPYTSVNYDFDL